MAATAASLLSLLNNGCDIAYYTYQQTQISNRIKTNLEILNRYETYEAEWEKAYDKCYYDEDGVEFQGQTFAPNNKHYAEQYAYKKSPHHDAEFLLELTDTDLNLNMMNTYYETALQKLRADEQSLKTLTAQNAGDTCMLNSGK